MLPNIARRLSTLLRNAMPPLPLLTPARLAHGAQESEADFNKRYIDMFLKWDIDGWELRQAMNDLCGMDMVPHPSVIEAGLRACRQLNDLALAIRWLEACKNKCGVDSPLIYPYIMRHIRPTLRELGIPTLEELGFDKPQLALESVFDM